MRWFFSIFVSLGVLAVCQVSQADEYITAARSDKQKVGYSETTVTYQELDRREDLIWVDDDNTAGPWDGSLEYPYQYIQDGIDHAADGDTIRVREGAYYENVIVDRAVTLFVDRQEVAHVIGDGFGDVIAITADNTSVLSFLISGTGDSPGDAGVEVRASHCTVAYNGFFDNQNAIRIYNATENEIIDNVIFGCDIWCSIGLNNSTYNTISGNTISHSYWDGISLDNNSSHNVVSGNTVLDNELYAISIENGSCHNEITGNSIRYSHLAMEIWESPDNVISENTLIDNESNTINIYSTARLAITDNQFIGGGGLSFNVFHTNAEDSASHTITGNTVDGAPIYYMANTDSPVASADAVQVIMAQCTNVLIDGLNIQDGTPAIQLWACNNCTVSNNNIEVSKYTDGILMRYCTDTQIVSNQIVSTYDRVFSDPANNLAAVYIQDGTDDLIQNNTIRGFNQGILIRHWNESLDNVIRDNDIASNMIGIWLIQAGGIGTGMTVRNNIFSGCPWGAVSLAGWTDVCITGNRMAGCSISIEGETPEEWNSHTITDNTVNDLPILYYVDESDVFVPSNAGQVILADCERVDINDLEIIGASNAISGGYCTDVTISDCMFVDCGETAIYFDESDNLLLLNNEIRDGGEGARVDNAFSCEINSNIFHNCLRDGILLYYVTYGTITNNAITQGDSNGIECWYSPDLYIHDNLVTCFADMGIFIYACTGANIYVNILTSNGSYGLLFNDQCTGNNIVGNEFVDNQHNAKEVNDSTGNIWSLDTGGNYWSDFAENPGYPDYYEIPGDGDGVDYHPLESPFRCPFACADLDGDCEVVDFDDFEILVDCWDAGGETCDDYGCSDLNGDGNVDMHDFASFSRLYGALPSGMPLR